MPQPLDQKGSQQPDLMKPLAAAIAARSRHSAGGKSSP
jgi:hypothetical protein